MKSTNFIKAFWYLSNNFGDNLNYYLIEKISGKQPVYTDNRKEPHFICCGSILSEASRFSTIWGAGGSWYDNNVDSRANIIALRGHLSQELVTGQAQAYADPALLLPRFYKKEVNREYEYGILPHWKDLEKTLWIAQFVPGIHVINPLNQLEKVIDEINMCGRILSSSLHGLIVADAYGIPNKWLDMGTEIGGDGFKFKDYYSTTDSPDENPTFEINFEGCRVHPYKHNLDHFLNLCPFK